MPIALAAGGIVAIVLALVGIPYGGYLISSPPLLALLIGGGVAGGAAALVASVLRY